MAALHCFLLYFVAAATILIPVHAQLTTDFYHKLCPSAIPTTGRVVAQAIRREPRMGASLLRLQFHDCFVNGCDGSNLLDDTANFTGEKIAAPNLNSLRGFDVVDEIKSEVNRVCHGNVVSCADIVAVAARDSVFLVRGPYYDVLLGRRDATTARKDAANNDLPPPFFSLSELVSNFQSHGLDLKDLVVLSGGHTIGLARCTTFRDRIYTDTDIDSNFALSLQSICPTTGGDNNTAPLDATTAIFDTQYFNGLVKSKGLLHSDRELYKGDGSDSDKLVSHYSSSPKDFAADFAASMIKMGNMSPPTGTEGEIRLNCRRVNQSPPVI